MVFWVLLAAWIACNKGILSARGPYVGPHAWVSAHCAVMAKAFDAHGVGTLGVVPIQNNPPLRTTPDAYIHWPPLFMLLLSAIFRVFGDSEAAARGFMLAILGANCLAMFFLLKTSRDLLAACFAVLAFLRMPAVLKYGSLVFPLPLAIFWMLLAILGFVKSTAGDRVHRGWAVFGLVSMVLAVFTSWEAVLASIGLLAAGIWDRRKAVVWLAVLYCAVAAASAVGVIALYLLKYPSLLGSLWHIFLFRTGAASSYRPGLPSISPSFIDVISKYGRRLNMIGPLFGVLGAAGMLLAAWPLGGRVSNHRLTTTLGALFAPPVLWYIFMWNHAYWHEFQVILVVPAVAASVGVFVSGLADVIDQQGPHTVLRWIPFGVLFMILPAVIIWTSATRLSGEPAKLTLDHWFLRHAGKIQSATGHGSVVLSPSHSRVVTYYCQRHIIHAVANDADVERVLAGFGELFPHRPPVYLALGPADTAEFPESIERFATVTKSANLILLRIDPKQIWQEIQ